MCTRKCAHEHTGQRRTSDIPCAMALRLMACSPRRTAIECTHLGCRDWRRLIPCECLVRGGQAYVDGDWVGTIWRSSPGKRGASLHAALVRRPGSCIRRLAGSRAQEVRFTRFLRNVKVGVAEMVS